MIHMLFVLLLSSIVHAAPNEISGEVTLAEGLKLQPGGVLFVIAKAAGRPMPLAVARVPEPKFPQKFTLSAKNAMTPGSSFSGPYLITARYSPSGDAMDKSGPEGADTKPASVGRSDVKIELKKR